MVGKLDFLMSLTETRNSVLSKAVAFDPSYISRIRSGQRGIPKIPQFTEKAADYFARNLRSEDQRAVLAEAMGLAGMLPEDRDELVTVIAEWLSEENKETEKAVGRFIGSFTRNLSAAAFGTDAAMFRGEAGAEKKEGAEAPGLDRIRERTEALERQYAGGKPMIGNEGKRDAVERFLGRLCLTGKPYRLLLFSDEEMSWLYEDPDFAKRWAALLLRLLSAGTRIVIPHNITRNKREMFEAVEKWIPLYMTGSIEPWYYPGFRDGIIRRSLFIAEGTSALTSSSVGTRTEGMLNLLNDDPLQVEALTLEFQNYLSLCRPLMQVFTPGMSKELTRTLLKFTDSAEAGNNLLFAHTLPSAGTFPDDVRKKLSERDAAVFPEKIAVHSRAALLRCLKSGGEVTEVIHLPSISEVREGKVLFPAFLREDQKTRQLPPVSPELLSLQLKEVIRLLLEEPGYRVVLTDAVPRDVALFVRDGSGAFLMRSEAPSGAFFIREEQMIRSFRDYIVRLAEDGEDKEAVVGKLRQYAAGLSGE